MLAAFSLTLATSASVDVVSLTNGGSVHPDRAAAIAAINAGNASWTAAPQERFATLAPGASKPLCGVLGDHKQAIADALAAGEIEYFKPQNPDAPIPDSFDSETNWPACAKIIGDIRDQSNCGCCWAFAGAEAASDRMCIATQGKLMVPLSAEDVCFCASFNGCDGGQITTPWSYVERRGAVSGGQYQGSGPFGKQCADFTLPHCHHHGPKGQDPYPSEGQPGCESQKSPRCPKTCEAGFPGTFKSDKYSFSGGSVQTASGEEDIQRFIMEGGPVETAFTVYSDFEDYAGGVYHHTSGQQMGGHAVKFVGWGVDPTGGPYWKVANSWNPYWGEKGYFRIKRGDSEGGIEDGVTGSPASATWSKAQ